MNLAIGILAIKLAMPFSGIMPRPVTSVRVEADVLILEGTIDAEAAAAVEAALKASPELRRLRITSAGGQAPDAVRIGELVRQRSLDVEVTAYCASACAQYVFVAGKRKIVGPGAFVAFHGTSASIAAELLHSPFANGVAVFAPEIAREEQFYHELSIDPALLVGAVTYLRPFCVFIIPVQPSNSVEHYAVVMAPQAYVLDYASMVRLGILGIEGFWPKTQASLDDAVRRQPFKKELVVKYATGFDSFAIRRKAAKISLLDCTTPYTNNREA